MKLTKTNLILITFFLIVTILEIATTSAIAHDGHVHAAPKGIESLHGGFLQGAEHIHHTSQEHDHGDASKRKFYFEVVYNKEAYLVYVHKLKTEGSSELVQISPSNKIKLVGVEQVNPRQKSQRNKLNVTTNRDHWKVAPVEIRGKRTMLNLSLMNGTENFQATVQVERR